MKRFILSVLAAGLITGALAQVPGTLSYQGILVDGTGTPVADGVHFVKFDFYNVATGGAPVYSSTGTGSGNSVTTYKGMFTFVIGSGSVGNAAIPASIWGTQLYVELTADVVVLAPRIQLTTNPYSFKAESANTIIDNAITSAKITDGTIAVGDLGTGSVNSLKILDGEIVNADINASAAIADTKLATISTPGKVSGNAITTGTIGGALIGTGISATNITTGSLSGALVGTGISATNVTTGTLPLSVLPASLLSGTGTAGQLAIWTGASALSSNANLFWDNTNFRLGLGTTAPSRRLHLVGAGGSTNDDMILETNGAGANAGLIRFMRSQGTFAAPTSALAGDQLGSVTFAGYSTAFNNGAEIFSNAETTFSTAVNAYLGFSTAAAGTLAERMRITSAGNVGIGTLTPTAKLQVNAGSGASVFTDVIIGPGGYFSGEEHNISFRDGTGNIGSVMVGYNGMGYFSVGNLYNGTHQTGTKQFTVLGNGNVGIGTTTPVNLLDVEGGVAIGATYSGTTAAPANGAIIQGKVGIGTNAPSTWGLLNVASDISIPGTGASGLVWVNGNTMLAHQHRWGASNSALYITNAGTSDLTGVYLASGATSWTSSSDRRLKENIFDTSYGLDAILRLSVKEFNFRTSKEKDKKIGFIAQEVYEVIPEIVQKGDDGEYTGSASAELAKGTGFEPWGVDYAGLTPILVKSTQEQQKQIEDLKTTVAILKARLSLYESLSAQVEELKKLITANEHPVTPSEIKASSGGNNK